MCIFYTFVSFYKIKMQYLYSFTKSFFYYPLPKLPIPYYLCLFSHYMVWKTCFRNTYCVTDDILYQGHKFFRPQELAHKWAKDLVTRPGTLKCRSFLRSGISHTSFFYISVFKTVVPRCTSRTGSTIFCGTGSFFRLFAIYSTHNSVISSTG